MPGARYVGSDTGEGNPPGKHSPNYLSEPTGEYAGPDHFVGKKSYRGDMNIGINNSATEADNQPKQSSSDSLDKWGYKEDSIPQVGSQK